jgi:S-adenosylmethionine:tRNA ribosyltransferase-isomerase
MLSTRLRTSDFEYELPSKLIAQRPAEHRDQSRLLILERRTGTIEHGLFSDIAAELREPDVLVANRSKVIPARIAAKKATGGEVELLLVRPLSESVWVSMAKPGRRLSPGMKLSIPDSALEAELDEQLPGGMWTVHFTGSGDIGTQIRAAGQVPLPPYITDPDAPLDRYQTVYADRDGSVAAPTAGLHFSDSLLESIRNCGVDVRFLTLHVGPGTFQPVKAEQIEDHVLHPEWGELTAGTADAINAVRERGGRVIAVGTTTTRLLEFAFHGDAVRPFVGETSLFIYPGYRFRAVDALVTNFHLPRSTLLMLVCAFAERDMALYAYREAVRLEYRFYSFGDAMLIL